MMHSGASLWRALAACGVLVWLAACELLLPPMEMDAAPDQQAPTVDPVARSAESLELERFYAGIEADLRSQGLLRRDGGTDVPFGARALAQNFTRIALYDEYTDVGGRLVARPSASRLRRWEGPVTLGVEFGRSVPLERRRADMRNITAYAARLSAVTGRTVRVGGGRPNFHVLILNEDERRDYGPRLRQLVPGIAPAAVSAITDMPRSTFCLVFAFSGASAGSTYSTAVAVIRGEHPELLRLSCIHEEIAQGMGLANDSPAARPSIFNDDEEFGLLTRHDELLLRMLYDPRLKVGMGEAEASPIAEEIAAELFGGES